MTHRQLAGALILAAAGLLPGVDHAQTLESLVMPGPVIEGHSDLEDDCSSCHVAFKRRNQRALCMDCHEDVAADIATRKGFHGRDDEAREQPCAECHTDHEGRDAVIVDLDPQRFDHDVTDFALDGSHTDAECGACHPPGERHRSAPTACSVCHQDDDVHEDALGSECADCHTTEVWEEAVFDHDATGYPLLGRHADTLCLDCHEDRTFLGAPTDCYACHQADDVHEGRSGQQCDQCHDPSGWEETRFDHARDTAFPLDGRHGELACGDCHGDDPFRDELRTECISCHRDDDTHDGSFGAECELCHVSTDWTESRFDHERDTGHALDGAHAALACADCHTEPLFEVTLPTACNDCHADEDPHEGNLGSRCADCHNESSWEDEVFFDHDLTVFPLLGAHAEAACDDCHATRVYSEAPQACVDCHREDDPHEGRYTEACADCHNPVDWSRYAFAHDAATDFPLTGAHVGLACADCHRQPLAVLARSGERCGDCHRSDDVHDGEFGPDCGRCHSASSFQEVRSIQ
jgi:hypothetical protein